MSEKYGEEMAYLNGFGDNQLSYTDFIDNFIDKETVADVSVDGNSNVGNKDMRTLMNEMPKPNRKLLAYNKIYYELNKEYDLRQLMIGSKKNGPKHFIYMMLIQVHTFTIVLLTT